MEVESLEARRDGEVILIGDQEAKTVINKGSLVFRFPLERDDPEGPLWKTMSSSKLKAIATSTLSVTSTLWKGLVPKGLMLPMKRSPSGHACGWTWWQWCYGSSALFGT